MDYKPSDTYESALQMPFSKRSFEIQRQPKLNAANQSQAISDLMAFFYHLQQLFDEGTQDNMLNINNELIKFVDVFCKNKVPFVENVFTQSLANHLISLLHPIDPIGLTAASTVMHLIRSSDEYAAFFVDGEIIERGDHDELIAQKGRYYQLYTGQFELE